MSYHDVKNITDATGTTLVAVSKNETDLCYFKAIS